MIWKEQGFDDDQAYTQAGECAVEVVVFRTCFVFAHAGIANPVVTDLGSCPMPAHEVSKGTGAAWSWRLRADVIGLLRGFERICCAGALDEHQAACPWQVCLQGIEGKNLYVSLIKSSVGGVDWLFVGKRGVPLLMFSASL